MSATASAGDQTFQLGPISIEIGGPGSRPYKSIDHLVWNGIPPFAVLTGLNGAGKTQLLEILAYRLTATNHPQLGTQVSQTRVAVTGAEFTPDDVVFLPSSANLAHAQPLGLAQMQQTKNQLWQQLQSHNAVSNMATKAMRERLQKHFGVQNLDQLGQAEFTKRLPDDFAFMLEEVDIVSGLSHVFVAHRMRSMECLERGSTTEEVLAAIGPAPWDVLNDAFTVAEFPYRVRSPIGTKFLDAY